MTPRCLLPTFPLALGCSRQLPSAKHTALSSATRQFGSSPPARLQDPTSYDRPENSHHSPPHIIIASGAISHTSSCSRDTTRPRGLRIRIVEFTRSDSTSFPRRLCGLLHISFSPAAAPSQRAKNRKENFCTRIVGDFELLIVWTDPLPPSRCVPKNPRSLHHSLTP